MNVNDAIITCNTGFYQTVSFKVIDIPVGAKVGVMWGYVISGVYIANNPDNLVAKSYKGPVIFYMRVKALVNFPFNGIRYSYAAEKFCLQNQGESQQCCNIWHEWPAVV